MSTKNINAFELSVNTVPAIPDIQVGLETTRKEIYDRKNPLLLIGVEIKLTELRVAVTIDVLYFEEDNVLVFAGFRVPDKPELYKTFPENRVKNLLTRELVQYLGNLEQ